MHTTCMHVEVYMCVFYRDVLSALVYLHGREVGPEGKIKKEVCIHRDLKAANILLSESGTAKLIDFGISVLSGETSISAILL